MQPSESNAVPKRFVLPSEARNRHIQTITRLEETLANLSKEVLKKRACLLITAELEGVCVVNGPDKAALSPRFQGHAAQQTLNVFENSPYVLRVDMDEPVLEGATETTHDGNYARQIEIITRPRKLSGKPVHVLELARVLEIVPQLMSWRAPDYGLKRVDFGTAPFRSDADQNSSCQFNINLVADDGANLYADADNYESPFHICCVQESLEFDKDGLIVYAPTPDAYRRLTRASEAGPAGHGVRPRRSEFGSSTYMFRGPNRDVARAGDPRTHKHIDTGGVRTEHRLPSPEAIMLSPDRSPYLIVETYLWKHIRALERFKNLNEKERRQLTPESLWAMPLEAVPRRFEDAVRLLKESRYLEQNYPELQKAALDVIFPVKEKARVATL